MAELDETQGVGAFDLPRPSQAEVAAAPLIYADGQLGVATAAGIARVTFGSLMLNVEADAEVPSLHPVCTLVMSESALLAFAREMLARAEMMGIEA